MSSSPTDLRRLVWLGLAALLVAGLSGCATDSVPTASADAELAPAPAGRTVFSLGTSQLVPAAKGTGHCWSGENARAAREWLRQAERAARDAVRRYESARERAERAQRDADRRYERFCRAQERHEGGARLTRAEADWRAAQEVLEAALAEAETARQEAESAAADVEEASGILAKMVSEGSEDDGAVDDEALEDPGRATYEAAAGTWEVVGVIGSRGGRLVVDNDGGTHSRDDDLRVSLQIPANAQPTPIEITMTVFGQEALSTLAVAFQPEDLEFAKDAILLVRVGKDLVDVDVKSGQIQVEHESADEVTQAETTVRKNRSGTVTLIVRVPGFSVFSMGGGR